MALLAFAIWSKRTYARRRGDWTQEQVQLKANLLLEKNITDPNKQPFLGCTNYKPSGAGCNNMIALKYYKKHMPDNMLSLYEARQAEEKKQTKQASKSQQ